MSKKDEKIFTINNCIDEWEDYPSRHDQTIMIVTKHNNKVYCLEELNANKYGGFNFNVDELKEIIDKINNWKLKLNREVWIKGKCGENY